MQRIINLWLAVFLFSSVGLPTRANDRLISHTLDLMIHDLEQCARFIKKDLEKAARLMDLDGDSVASPSRSTKDIRVNINDKDKKQTLITFTNISSDIKKSATFHDKLLTLTTETEFIKICTHTAAYRTLLSVTIEQNNENTTHEQATKHRNCSCVMRTLSYDVELDKAVIEYEQATTTLTIILPTAVPQIIPIQVK